MATQRGRLGLARRPDRLSTRLIPDNDSTDSDGSLKSPDILTGPITNGQTSSRLDWNALGMGPNEVRTVVRNYQVNCNPGGPYGHQVIVNASSLLPGSQRRQ